MPIMKNTTIKMLAGFPILCFFLSAPPVQAQEEKPVERVSLKDGKLTIVRDGKSMPLETNITLVGDIKVTTNGTFTVKAGKERRLQEGQILRADGTITGTDGSITPVFDHVTLKNGRTLVVKDGEGAVANREIILDDGSKVTPDGTLTTKGGRRIKLLDGQIYKLDGMALPAKDTITLKDGKVMVQKDGSLLQVQPKQSVMMSDGTKVFGDGSVIMKDGKKITLTEGQLMVIEGVTTKTRGY